MNQKIFYCLFALILACKANNSYEKAENPLDAAREYIDGTLKGEFEKVRFYMLKNKANELKIEAIQQKYYGSDKSKKEEYRKASIVIYEEKRTSPNSSVIIYKNLIDNKLDTFSVILHEGVWLVDSSS